MSNRAARSAVLSGSRPTRATTSNPAARRARTWVTHPKPVPNTTTPLIAIPSRTARWSVAAASRAASCAPSPCRSSENTSTPSGAVVPVSRRARERPAGRTRPLPGSSRSCSVASTRLASAASGPSSSWIAEDALARDAGQLGRASTPARTRCQASMLSPPLGGVGRLTIRGRWPGRGSSTRAATRCGPAGRARRPGRTGRRTPRPRRRRPSRRRRRRRR